VISFSGAVIVIFLLETLGVGVVGAGTKIGSCVRRIENGHRQLDCLGCGETFYAQRTAAVVASSKHVADGGRIIRGLSDLLWRGAAKYFVACVKP
jgi:hypothetical protein